MHYSYYFLLFLNQIEESEVYKYKYLNIFQTTYSNSACDWFFYDS